MTLDRHSDALDVTTDPVSFALDAASPAASLAFAAVSAVVEACLKFCRRRRNRDCRISARVAGGADMAAGVQRLPDGGAKSCRKGSHLRFELKRVNWRLSWVFGGRPALKKVRASGG